MILELPEALETAVKRQANARGVSPAGYVRELLERELEPQRPPVPLKSCYGILAKYGPAPSAEEIDENRADMFRGFGENF